jgi:hypothetical protein
MAPSDTKNGVAEEEGLMTSQSASTDYIEHLLTKDQWYTM